MSKRIFLTTADVSPWTAPADFNPNSNTVEVIGGGGGGAHPAGTGGGGGGGGAYSKATNVQVAAGGTATFQVGAGGAGGVSGTTGGDTWFNGASLAASSVGAKGGGGAPSSTGGAGGFFNTGVGSPRFSGGSGGTFAGGSGACGGGGAAGPNGDGQSANSGGGNGTGGGAGDQAFGGAGGIADAGGAGGAGTEFDATHGSGGGGGGGSINGGAGGAYGGGGGGSNSGSAAAGADGLIVITYTPDPQLVGGWYQNTSIPARFGQNFIAAGSGSDFAVPMVPPGQFWGFEAGLEYQFTKPFPATEQQFSTGRVNLSPTAVTPQGWQGDFGAQFAKPFPAGDQHFNSFRFDQAPSAAPQLFWGYSAYNYVLLPFEVTEQQFLALNFPLPATAVTPQGWVGSFEPFFNKPLSPALQQFIATRTEQPSSKTSLFWGYSASDETLLPLEACYQQFSDVPLKLFGTAATPQGWQGDFGYAFAKPLSVTQQPVIGFTPQGNIPTQATPQGWVGDIGVGFVKPFPAAQQSFIGNTPQGQIATQATPIGGWNVTPTYAFAKPFSAAQQQFSTGRVDTPPTAVSPQGWVSSLEYAFAKTRPVNLNPWLGYFSSGSTPTQVTPYGWYGYQPERFTQQFPVTLQQYFAFQPRGIISVQAPATVDPYIYPGDKIAKRERDKLLPKTPYDPRKLTRKQRKLIAQLEAQRWEQLTSGPTRAEKMHEDMQAAIAEVLAAAEKKRIEDAKVSGLFAAPPSVGLEASLHAAIRVVKELERQHELDEARKALVRAKQEAQAKAERDIVEAKERERAAKLAALKAKKATEDAKLLTRYKMKKKLEADEINDAVFNSLKSTRLGRDERAEILESVLDIARRRK